jgi:hypothetical protein
MLDNFVFRILLASPILNCVDVFAASVHFFNTSWTLISSIAYVVVRKPINVMTCRYLLAVLKMQTPL